MKSRVSGNILWWGLAWALFSGCVTVYQPMVGLQRPVAIEPAENNFKGLRLEINCRRGDFLWHDEAEQLCNHASKLFTSQGATVRTTTEGQSPEDEEGEGLPGGLGGESDIDLRVDLTPRIVHEEKNVLTFVLMVASATLIPGVSEYTFAQDITVRDSHGFLFASDHWQARFVRYVGAAVWGVNFILDYTLRRPGDRITGDALAHDFSRDYFRQLNQLVFNAKTRWALLREPPPVVVVPKVSPARLGDK
ncbi:MAG: hypothetical protein ACYC8T_22925 [Myxococcaceae bacterium]